MLLRALERVERDKDHSAGILQQVSISIHHQ